jgi:uncharacterized protein YecE (DUF72 family)
MSIRVGLCGIGMARDKYVRTYPVTEVQQTFYEPPKLSLLERWREQAPRNFEFTLKAWQLITHTHNPKTYRRLKTPIPKSKRKRYGRFQLTDEVMKAWRVTLECTRALEARILIFQCPASFTPTDENVANLRGFFDAIRPETKGLILGWEPRGAWPRDLIQSLMKSLGLLYVVDPFKNEPLPGGLRYFRLHGKTNYFDKYTAPDLRALRSMCRGNTYVMFNNVPMVQDSRRFLSLLKREKRERRA